MADISKIKISAEKTVNLKDAQARADMSTLLGTHALEALKAAAWRDVAATISDGNGKIADAATVKAYVDSQIGTIHKFDIVVCAADATKIPEGAEYKDGETTITGTMAASEETMFKLYLVKNDRASAGNHIEWISIRSGSEGAYTYDWEKIGSTQADLSGYVPKTAKIANVTINDGISTEDLSGATSLNLKALSHKDSGKVTVSTADSLTMNSYSPEGTVAVTLVDDTATDTTIVTKDAYTPAGVLKVDGDVQKENNKVLKGGTITVTLKNVEASATGITYGAYTPAGTVAITANENGTFQVAGSNADSAVSFSGGTTKNVLTSVKDAAVLPSFTDNKIGTFVAPELQSGFVTNGSAPSFTQGSKAALTDQTKGDFATQGIIATIDETDEEMLVFTAASTAKAVTDRGTFTANGNDTWSAGTMTSVDVSKFSAGSWTAGTFNAGSAATFNNADVVDNIGTGTAAAQVFTGSKFNPSFAGSAENIKATAVAYNEQAIDTATFSGTEAALTFAGTETANLIPSKITYVPKKIGTSTFTGTAATLTGTVNKSDKDINVTFS